jgi:hypothetical protein
MLQNQGEEKNWTLMKLLQKQQETKNCKWALYKST